MTFGDHLEELRKRLILAMLVPIPVLVVCLVFGGQLLEFMLRPMVNALTTAGATPTLIATSPFETFAAYFKVGFIVSLLISFPWILYQLWLFIAPGLYAQERRFVYFFIPLSSALTAIGSLFLYYFLLPVSLVFLIGFGQTIVQRPTPMVPMPEATPALVVPVVPGTIADAPVGSVWFDTQTASLSVQVDERTVMRRPFSKGTGVVSQDYRVGEYISLVFTMALAFSVAFQLPIVLLLLSWVGIIEAKTLAGMRQYVIMACAVLGAVLTPQDPLSMIMLGGALYLLFEFGMILMRFVTPDMIRGNKKTFDADE